MERRKEFIALAALIIGQFGWLKWDIGSQRTDIALPRRDVSALGERVARIESALSHADRAVTTEKMS